MYPRIPADLPLPTLILLGVFAACVLVVVASASVIERATARRG